MTNSQESNPTNPTYLEVLPDTYVRLAPSSRQTMRARFHRAPAWARAELLRLSSIITSMHARLSAESTESNTWARFTGGKQPIGTNPVIIHELPGGDTYEIRFIRGRLIISLHGDAHHLVVLAGGAANQVTVAPWPEPEDVW